LYLSRLARTISSVSQSWWLVVMMFLPKLEDLADLIVVLPEGHPQAPILAVGHHPAEVLGEEEVFAEGLVAVLDRLWVPLVRLLVHHSGAHGKELFLDLEEFCSKW
jgi:hypothetical protein